MKVFDKQDNILYRMYRFLMTYYFFVELLVIRIILSLMYHLNVRRLIQTHRANNK